MDEMNTINSNGTAYDGRRGPVVLAVITLGIFIFGTLIAVIF